MNALCANINETKREIFTPHEFELLLVDLAGYSKVQGDVSDYSRNGYRQAVIRFHEVLKSQELKDLLEIDYSDPVKKIEMRENFVKILQEKNKNIVLSQSAFIEREKDKLIMSQS